MTTMNEEQSKAAKFDPIYQPALLVIALKVRRNGPQPSLFVRTFSAITITPAGAPCAAVDRHAP